MVLQLKFLLPCFDLCDKVIVYVRDEGANLNTLTNVLINIVSCVPWLLAKLYVVFFSNEFLFFCNLKIGFQGLYLILGNKN
jgi:hypothetical protein